jgi:hypothetical protein
MYFIGASVVHFAFLVAAMMDASVCYSSDKLHISKAPLHAL